ncbi:PAS domain S-box protein [Desulfofundulus thermosubterraneus]|uniref:histidine kinase n=1 Tax=Desulfofundulus thermosubterraneus DSM 16057 TaxID=1121432 RepID=A0A1M6B2K0_9FIRM|nr:PAS domain S-box protein [Desulfofundulus thermosubterraneus]SHI42961.1 PAS domain S-box-containing protein [Desulfofundulus thermosubterraneus DSM 16057]
MFAQNWLPALKAALLAGLFYLTYSLISLLYKIVSMQYTANKALVTSTVLGHTLLLFIAMLLPLGIYKRRLSHQSRPYSKAEQYTLNSILDTFPMAIMIVDTELNISYINGAWEQLVGYTREEVVGKKLTELLQWLQEGKTTSCPPGEDPETFLLCRKIEITGKNGEEIHLTMETKPIMRGNNREGTVIYFQNINTQVEYDLLKQTFDTILQQMVGGVVVVDSTGRILITNHETERVTGQSASSITGKFVWELFPNLDRKELVTVRALEKGEAVGPLEVHYKVNDKDFCLLVRSDVLRDRYGRVSGAVTVFNDITELHRQQELQHNQEKLAVVGQMAAGMAHELRNPLTSIKGFAQLLSERLEDAKNKEYLDVIIQEVDRTNEIISDFLVLARPHSTRGENVDLNRLINELLPLVESQCLLTQVELVPDLAPELPSIKAQPDQLKQVLLNLIHNALQAMEDQPVRRLTLISRWPAGSDEILLGVRDTGHGMSGEILSRLSTPFFTTKDAGTGLGLTISYRIIESHGGRIEVNSQEGIGSEFRIYLPVQGPGQIH